ncbi:MAG: MarR family winged helix-turn-helix transcriptional regulator [Thermoleophilia bacterium]
MTDQHKLGIRAWVRLIGASSALGRWMNAELQQSHGLTVMDMETLRQLSEAPDGRMRRTDLAQAVGLTPSGITRLLDGLEEAGLVGKAHCASDGRVSYAEITGEGEERLADATITQSQALEAVLTERYGPGEIETLVDLLGRLPGAGDRAPGCPGTHAGGQGEVCEP